MKRLFKPLLSLLVGFALGCGIGPHVDDYNESLVAAALATCTCGGFTFGDEAKCRAEFPPNGAEQGCLEALFKNTEGDWEAHLDCRAAANNRYASCINGSSCTDLLRRLECLNQLNDELEDCPKFPSELKRDHDDCLD